MKISSVVFVVFILCVSSAVRGVEILNFDSFVAGHAGSEELPRGDKQTANRWWTFKLACETNGYKKQYYQTKGGKQWRHVSIPSGKTTKQAKSLPLRQQGGWKVCWQDHWSNSQRRFLDDYF